MEWVAIGMAVLALWSSMRANRRVRFLTDETRDALHLLSQKTAGLPAREG